MFRFLFPGLSAQRAGRQAQRVAQQAAQQAASRPSKRHSGRHNRQCEAYHAYHRPRRLFIIRVTPDARIRCARGRAPNLYYSQR